MDEKIKLYSLAKYIAETANIRSVGNLLYAYNGMCYVFCDDDALNRLIFETGFQNNPDNATPKIINDIARLIKMLPQSRDIKPNSCLWLFNNTAVDLMTEKTYELLPDIFSTSHISSEYIPSVFDTSSFDIFLHSITAGDKQLASRILQTIGYILSPDNNAGVFIYVYSKSLTVRKLLGKLLRSFFSENMISAIDLYDMGNRFNVFELNGKKLNINMNISSGVLNAKNTRILKELTDPQNIFLTERRYHTTYKIINSCKLVFGAEFNLQPNTYDTDFKNRVLYLPLSGTPDKEILTDDFGERLLSEKPSIIRKAMEAYRELLNNGYRFANQSEYDADFGNDGLINIHDIIPMFVDECLEITEAGLICSYELEKSFNSFCEDKNIFIPVTKTKLSSALKKYLGNAVISKKIRMGDKAFNGFMGITLQSGDC